jgi:hypothetical protein
MAAASPRLSDPSQTSGKVNVRAICDRRTATMVLRFRSATQEARMETGPLSLAEVDERLSVVRDNLRELVEQAAAYSGAGDEELMGSRIAKQEAQLEQLTQQREALLQRPS